MLALAVLGWTQGLTGFSQPKPSHEFMISLQHPKSLIPRESSAQNLTWVEEPKVTSEQKRGRKIQVFFFCFLEDLVHSFLTPQFPGVHVRYCIEKFPWMRSFSAKRATPPSSQPLLQEELSSLEITPQTLIIQTGLKTTPNIQIALSFQHYLLVSISPLCLCSVPGTENEPGPVWELPQGCLCPAGH